MSEKPTPKSAAERKRAQRQRMRDGGRPAIPAFDRALRDALFASYQAGSLVVDIPELVQNVVRSMASDGDVSERGCREIVRGLLARAAETGGHARVHG